MRLARPNGLTEVNTYGADGLIRERAQPRGGTTVSSVRYGYDALGRVATVEDELGPERYTYDPEGNLASVDYPAGSPFADESFTVDSTGNRTSWAGNPSSQVRHDAAGRLVEDAERSYAYDAEGNLVARTDRASGAVTYFVWNTDHTLRSVTAAGSTTMYGYDAFGRRTSSATGGSTTTWAYSGSAMVAELAGAGSSATVRQSFTVLPSTGDALAATAADGTDLYAVTDRLGSVTALTDATGAEVSRTRWFVFF